MSQHDSQTAHGTLVRMDTAPTNDFGGHASAAMANIDASEISTDVEFVLEQQVTENGEIVDQYHVVIANGAVNVVPGPAPSPDVVLKQDAATARSLRDGTLHAQNAFLTGRLSIDGDINSLLEHGPLIAQLLPGLGS